VKTTGFQLSLVDLKRTEGATKDFSFSAGMEQTLEVGLVSVPVGRQITVHGQLQSVGEGVLVTGEFHTEVDAQCSRCLKQTNSPVEARIEELYIYSDKAEGYDQQDVLFIHQEMVDLDQPIRDGLILEQPLIPLCDPDCLGLCQHCGLEMNSQPTHTHDDDIDSRWLSLGQWGKMS
jgi:uncharacterized protein